MNEGLQVKPTLRERLLYELPADALVFGVAVWLLNRYVNLLHDSTAAAQQ